MSTDQLRDRVLIVEDEILVAMDLSDLLEELGFQVVGPAARVEDALGLIDRETGIDVALLDINLAGDRSWPVARELLRRGIGFAFLSGYELGQAGIPEDLREAPVCPKPIELEHLKGCIQKARSPAP